MIGQSWAFRLAEQLIDKIAAFDAPVLIEGETGTGKEIAARAIHYRGSRRKGPFVPVNCGALQDQLIENELFGHRRGAFTDARNHQAGLVELARAGTLFLDEVDALTLRGQVTLLRFLQDQYFRPLGGQQEVQADVRIIAATNTSLDRLAERGAFRLDLYYRLKVLCITLPPLRERYGDISLLARHFIDAGSARFCKPALWLDEATLDWFERYHWPGNVRELEHFVLRGFLLSDGPQISIPAPNDRFVYGRQTDSLRMNFRLAKNQAIAEFESSFLARLLEQANGNVTAAARISGTERRYLGRLLKKHRILSLPLREVETARQAPAA